MNSIEIYKSGELELNVSVKEGTIWLRQNEISLLFQKDRTVITRHINNIFKDNEVDEKSNVQKMHIANSDKPIKIYSLDIILAVGYRTNSAKAIAFRQWATSIIKDYIINGYTINSDKITNDRFVSLENQVKGISSKLDILESKNITPSQGIFYNGQIYDAYSFLNDLIKSAKKTITIIDNYCDDSILTLLGKNKDISIIIITSSISKQFKLDIEKYNAQYNNLKVKINKNYHDRFLLIDENELYHIGASLKDLGKKVFAFNKINKELLKIEEF